MKDSLYEVAATIAFKNRSNLDLVSNKKALRSSRVENVTWARLHSVGFNAREPRLMLVRKV